MKKYRLKKDLPNIKEGTIITTNEDGDYVNDENNAHLGLSYVPEHYPNFFEPVEDKPKRWRAENNMYWFICEGGEVGDNFEANTVFDDKLYDTGNYFQTKEEAEQEAKWIGAALRLRAYARMVNEGWTPSSHSKRHYVFYNRPGDILHTLEYFSNHFSSIYFKTEKLAVQSIRDCEEDYLIFFGIN